MSLSGTYPAHVPDDGESSQVSVEAGFDEPLPQDADPHAECRPGNPGFAGDLRKALTLEAFRKPAAVRGELLQERSDVERQIEFVGSPSGEVQAGGAC
jgi:hypothetical protein